MSSSVIDKALSPSPQFAVLSWLWRAWAGRHVILRAGGHVYDVGPRLARGDVADLYPVVRDGVVGKALLKIVRDPADNFLMDREAAALRRLRGPYAPALFETFMHRDERTGASRRVNVLGHAEDFVPLALFPFVPVVEAAWIRRRLLVALELAHGAGLAHGSLSPRHILIHPELHGLMLVGWCHWGGSPAIDLKSAERICDLCHTRGRNTR